MPYKDIEKRRECCRENYKKNKEKRMQRKKQWREDNKEKIKQYYQNNKDKILEQTKRYKEENKDRIKKNNKHYRKKNKEKISEQRKKYYKENKEQCIERGNKYRQKRYNSDITFRIGRCVSSSLNRYLKDNNLSKGGRRWENLVGYTVQELKNHITKLFKKGMTWDNYGEWHIDHIVPKSFFKYTSTDDVEFKYCWSLNNLQPLWAEENLSKSNKIIFYDQGR